VRRDTNEDIKKQEKDSSLSEDQAKRGMDEIQKLTDKYIEEINYVLSRKDKEIMEI
jgi:ribosome recycling factor